MVEREIEQVFVLERAEQPLEPFAGGRTESGRQDVLCNRGGRKEGRI